jgi:signal transduction histidine kinase
MSATAPVTAKATARAHPLPQLSLYGRLHQSFGEWVASLDPELGRTMGAPAAWALVTLTSAVSLAGAHALPMARQYFQLDVWVVAIAYVPALLLGLLIGELERRRAISRWAFGWLALAQLVCFQYFMWSLATLSRGPGAALMSLFALLLSAYHGFMLRAAPRQPFVALAVPVGATLSFLLHGSDMHLPLLSVSVPAAFGTALITGLIGLSGHRERMHALALREAIDAELMRESMQQAATTRNLLLQLQTNQHDARNALSAVLMAADRLAIESLRAASAGPEGHPLRESATELQAGLDRLRSLFDQNRRISRGSSRVVELVDLSDCLRTAIADTRRAHPCIDIVLAPTPIELQHLTVPICGGGAVLSRVLNNLLLNACEGDGVRGPQEITVTLGAPAGTPQELILRIEDDGPGFSQAMLDAPLRAFATTKAHGSGLGLYTCDRLLRASAGRLELQNGAPGGARVTVTLAREALL